MTLKATSTNNMDKILYDLEVQRTMNMSNMTNKLLMMTTYIDYVTRLVQHHIRVVLILPSFSTQYHGLGPYFVTYKLFCTFTRESSKSFFNLAMPGLSLRNTVGIRGSNSLIVSGW